jgi:hypothetical protein
MEQKAFAAGASELRFPLPTTVPVFHEFRCEGDCRLLSARIIEPDSKSRSQSAHGLSPR